ncbi:hypothetical protein Ahy_A08g039702 [Arachis hypogaea]|uniref:ADF-H domain-containing protein n=1 Tax=Arachis hypogaea TaxID=3818 RepID=A0A445BX30_ARAHY|nr:hypothetical protein Ahy_A08g039702 [Arachis hypogaea]
MANAASGMAIHDDCKLRFLELKTKRTHRFIVFKIEENQKQVIVEKLGEPAQGYEDFVACLPPSECCYAIYDFKFLTEGNVPKSRIFFIAWNPTISEGEDQREEFYDALDNLLEVLGVKSPFFLVVQIQHYYLYPFRGCFQTASFWRMLNKNCDRLVPQFFQRSPTAVNFAATCAKAFPSLGIQTAAIAPNDASTLALTQFVGGGLQNSCFKC